MSISIRREFKTIIKTIIRTIKMLFIKKQQAIVLSYSEEHFCPGIKNKFEYTSAGQLAKNIYLTLSKIDTVYYCNDPRYVKTDLLFSVNNWARCRYVKAKKTILFLPFSHLQYIYNILTDCLESLSSKDIKFVDRLFDKNYIKMFTKGLKQSDKIVIIGNETIKNTYLSNGVNPSKVTVLNCGIDYSHFIRKKRVESGVIIFCFSVTKLSIHKGISYLIEAWKDITQTHKTGVRLDLLGMDGDYDISDFKSLENVNFIGEYQAGSKFYINKLNEAHYVIFPSLGEGQAGTLLEAMSCGCVPIATRESGINADEYAGETLVVCNSDDITKKMNRAIKDFRFKQWQQKSLKTRSMIKKHHSWKNFNIKMTEIIKDYL